MHPGIDPYHVGTGANGVLSLTRCSDARRRFNTQGGTLD